MPKVILFSIGWILAFSAGVQAGDQSLRLFPGKGVSIELKENPSTGYSWRVDRDASANLTILRIVEGGFTPAMGQGGQARVGAPGARRWTIEALSKGRARVEFVYERPWEKQAVERHTVEVEVAAP